MTKNGRRDSLVASPQLSGFVCHRFTISIIVIVGMGIRWSPACMPLPFATGKLSPSFLLSPFICCRVHFAVCSFAVAGFSHRSPNLLRSQSSKSQQQEYLIQFCRRIRGIGQGIARTRVRDQEKQEIQMTESGGGRRLCRVFCSMPFPASGPFLLQLQPFPSPGPHGSHSERVIP